MNRKERENAVFGALTAGQNPFALFGSGVMSRQGVSDALRDLEQAGKIKLDAENGYVLLEERALVRGAQ